MKKNRVWFLLIAVILIFITGCGIIHNKVTEKVSEGVVEKASGGNVDITKDIKSSGIRLIILPAAIKYLAG